MPRPIRIFYVGTYEHDYPRNVLTIAALRRAGYAVREVNQPVWTEIRDKTALLESPQSLFNLVRRLLLAYSRLVISLVLRRKDADLIVFGYIGQMDVLLLGPLSKLFRIPVLFDPLITLTDTLVEDRGKLRPSGLAATAVKKVDQLALRLANVILADTSENRAFMASTFGVPAERVHVVPVGADERVFTPGMIDDPDESERPDSVATGDRLPLPGSRDGRRKVLFYGTMIPLQGVDTIVRAAKLLEGEIELEFEIIGRGQTFPAVKRCADELGVQNVTFIPRVAYEELPRRIGESDIVLGIFGTTAKAGRVVPNKIYQAMAMGAAIVTRDSPAVRHLLRDEESALLVPPDDPFALASAIRRLGDADLRSRLGRAARARFVEMASLDIQAAAIREAVETAVSASTSVRKPVTA